MLGTWQDLRHGARMLYKNPGFSLIAILSIAIGVGANAAMFSVADGLVLRPLPVPDAAGVVTIRSTTPTGQLRNLISYPDFVDLRDRAQRFEGLAAKRDVVASFVRGRDEVAQSKLGHAVSANFFDLLHIKPALGRGFLPDEDRVSGRDAVMVLAHETWTEQFGADPQIIGREVRLRGLPFTVIGVAPKDFAGLDIYVPPAFYVPMAMATTLGGVPADLLDRRDSRVFRVVGRLRPGASLVQAQEETAGVARALEQEHPDTNRGYGLLLRSEMDARLAEYAPLAALSAILVGLAMAVVLVACANVAGLLSSRAPVRAREIAVRLAIGGSRARLVRQLITESVLIALAGGVVGLALAGLGIRSFQQFQIASDVGVKLTYALDQRALLVALAVTAASALLSSAIPAWRSTRLRDLSSTLRNSTSPADRMGRLWGRHGLVASQIALTLVLLTVSLAFYRAFEAEYGRGPGFRTDHILLTNLDPGMARYSQDQSDAFYRGLTERVGAIPRVSAVAMTTSVPLNQDYQDSASMVPEGFELPAGIKDLTVPAARVDDHYFDAIGISIVGGRRFEATDTIDAPHVAIVSRGMAERYWPGQDPIGKRVRLTRPNEEWVQIVGVAADIKFRLFTAASTPFLYLPRLQYPSTRSTLIVRTEGESAEVATQVRGAVVALGRDVPILSMRTIEAFYHSNARNLNTVIVRTIAGMGIMGLGLALVGLYGLTAYAVSRRTREIGIRMALGALPQSVLQMILRQGLLPSVVGVVFGVMASIAVGGLTQRAFPGTAADSITYLLIVPVVVAVVLFAAYVPARRAARIDPLAALRSE
ncbi:MAG TPA: ABC transporter permease [Vicinamibacterales bacterium]